MCEEERGGEEGEQCVNLGRKLWTAGFVLENCYWPREFFPIHTEKCGYNTYTIAGLKMAPDSRTSDQVKVPVRQKSYQNFKCCESSPNVKLVWSCFS